MGRFKQLLIREGRGCRGKGGTVKRNNSAALGRVLIPSQEIYITIYLSCFADTEIPTRWKKLTVCCPGAYRLQTGWNQKVDDADSHLLHHQPIRRMSTSWLHHQPIRRMSTRWSRPLWTITIKLLTTPSRAGHTVLRALVCCGPLCLAKQ